jgi:NAD(P)H-dependent FMN reductase
VIIVLSGTNRKNARTAEVAKMTLAALREKGAAAEMLDLRDLPAGLFAPEHYGRPPAEFKPFQDMVLSAAGILTVVPEYNGSFPGALKYFLDLLKFPESLRGMPAAFIGLASGRFGAVRAVEQMEMVYQYREAHIFANRIFLPAVEKMVVDGRITDDFVNSLFHDMLSGFISFVNKLRT